MNTYRVYNAVAYGKTPGGEDDLIGVYDAPPKVGAIEAMCRHSGYKNLADAAAFAGETVEQYMKPLYIETVWSREESNVEKLARARSQ